MDRRKFCKTTLAAAVAAATPVIGACGKKAKVATEAEASVRGISLDGAEIELEKAAIRELGEALSGPVILPDSPDYDGARAIWNGMHDKRPVCPRTEPAYGCPRRRSQLARKVCM
jgi:uncharacterized membrane protein